MFTEGESISVTTTNPLSFLAVMKWTDDECRAYLERQRWPDGPRCPKCGAPNPYTITRKSPSKNGVKSLYRCRACKRQYTATVGTIFEDSHIPLSKWFAAIHLMCSSEKGISAHQLHRQLGITYRSAWFMCCHIREAMADSGGLPVLVGTIGADEAFVGGKPRHHHLHRRQAQREYEAGVRGAQPPRIRHVPDATRESLEPLLTSGIDLE